MANGRTFLHSAQISLYSWGDKNTKIYRPAVRFQIPVHQWRNPQCHPELIINGSGISPKVLKWMAEEERIGMAAKQIRSLAQMCINKQGTVFINVAFVDHYGQWISPAVAELVASDLQDHFSVGVSHEDVSIKT